MKTSELTGAALDWAVAKCLEPEDKRLTVIRREDYIGQPVQRETEAESYVYEWWSPSRTWAQGGPIIERECITVRPVFHAERTENGFEVYRQGGWTAHVESKAFWRTPRPFTGPAPLIAAMRCYVASKMGDDIEVPEELA